MIEQLNLRLEPALPRPGDVAPMWPTSRPDPFDSPDYLFEPTWGGHRVLAFVGPSERPGDGEVRIVDPTGRDLSDRLPELAGLAVRVAARSAVLDGELVVVDAYGTHEVKLAAGDAIVYPSGSLHRVEPVTRGERICSFLWTQSMVRDDTRRAMLFELDTHIQQLRHAHGDTEPIVGLTGHYHNLLRQWAEV